MSAALNLLSFPAQSAPHSLVEKYRPARIQDFAGIATVEVVQRKPHLTGYGVCSHNRTA